MKAKVDRTVFEREMNKFFYETYRRSEILQNIPFTFKYLKRILTAYDRVRIASMWRRCDPISFEVAYQEWKLKHQ